MAEIIQFLPLSVGRARMAPVEDAATILFFTGVRYQRIEDAAPAKPKAKSPSRPRKRQA